MPGVSSVGELLGGLLRGGQPARRDVGGPHRLRHVDHQHHHGAVARDRGRRWWVRPSRWSTAPATRPAGSPAGAATGWAAWARRFPATPCWRSAAPASAGPAARRCRARSARGSPGRTGRTTGVRSRDSDIGPSNGSVMRAVSCPFGRHASRQSLAPPASAPRRRDATNRTMSAIQSRSVRRVSSGAPQRRSVRATSSRCAVGGAGEVVAQLGVDGELAGDPGFGVLQDHVADVGQFDVARVEHLDAEHLVAGGDRAQRPHPVDRARGNR